MARIVVVTLLLSLAFVPIADAATAHPGESAAAEWFNSLRSTFAWLFSWMSTSAKASAMIIPDGVAAPPPPVRSTSENASAMIIPDGLRAREQEKHRVPERSHIRGQVIR